MQQGRWRRNHCIVRRFALAGWWEVVGREVRMAHITPPLKSLPAFDRRVRGRQAHQKC